MQVSTERYERLAAQVEYPEAWKPDEGETLIGRVIRWETVQPDPQESRTCEVCVVEDGEEKAWSIWTGRAQLRYKLIAPKDTIEASDDLTGQTVPVEERLAQAGDFVAIHYVGMKPIPDSTYEAASYRVAIDRPPDAAEGEKPETGSTNGEGEDGDIPF